MSLSVKIGDFFEYGAIIKGKDVTFTFATDKLKDASVLLFDLNTKKLAHEIKLSKEFSVGKVYSVCVSGLKWQSLCYLLKSDKKIYLDPYAKVIIGREVWMDEKRFESEYKVYGGFVEESYNWKAQKPLIPSDKMILYKLHMRGFTMDHKLPKTEKGNYKGIISLLPQLKDLGVSSLEFLPFYEFEEMRFKSETKLSSKKAKEVFYPAYGTNYWGYGEGNYFAPKASYFGGNDVVIHAKEMIDAIHGASMEAIMEISFSNEHGAEFINSVLEYWVREYHVDGFHLLGAALPVERVAQNPYLADTKLFYDNFSYDVLSAEDDKKHLFVYNDDFTYPLRRLQHHMDGNISDFADQMRRQGEHFGFVNYAASNSGFCLWDVYSYGEKHNQDNGEDNTDGSNYNCSHNHGFEGPTKKSSINKIRLMNARCAITSALLSQSVPLILSGDEINNSQSGNNNPYCQDNEIGWVNFSNKKVSAKKFRDYVKAVIRFRKEHDILTKDTPMALNDYKHVGIPDLSYHGREPWIMGIGAEKKAIGIYYSGQYSKSKNKEDVMLLYNFYYDKEEFAAPKLPGKKKWYFVTNTADDVFAPAKEPLVDQTKVLVPGGTVTILVGKEVSDE